MRCNATEKGMNEDEECFEGFAYDLIAKIAKDNNGFKFKFTTREDYGSLNHKTGKWTGIIGDLQSTVSTEATPNHVPRPTRRFTNEYKHDEAVSVARGPGHMRLDDHFRSEDRGGLYHAVHDVGH